MHLLLCKRFIPAVAELDHVGCQRHAHAAQIVAPAALQNFRRLLHLQGVADGHAERNVHVGEHRAHVAPAGLADGDHVFRQLPCVVQRFHKSARADLHIQYDRVRTRRELFGHDGGGNERQRVDRCRHITQRVELLVRRSQVARLADDRHADIFHLLHEFFGRERRFVARDGF